MKTLLIVLFAMMSSASFAQEKKVKFVELTGTVDYLGSVHVRWADYPQDSAGKIDNMIHSEKIDAIVKASRKKTTRITLINMMAEEGWLLASSVFIADPGAKGGTIYYYFKKEF